MERGRISALVSLLDDMDNMVAVPAMAELLSLGDDAIGPVVRELQESPDPQMRRRVHQIEAIIKARNARKSLSSRMAGYSNDLWRGLSELHLQWFDGDCEENVESLWDDMTDKIKDHHPRTSRRLAEAMAAAGFATHVPGDLDLNFLCLGTILEDGVGADFMLCAIAMRLGNMFGWEGGIVRTHEGFALLDYRHGQIIFPNGWRVEKAAAHQHETFWNVGMLLRYAAYQLLACSISLNNPRYAHILSTCVAPRSAAGTTLPYPFGNG